MSLPDEPIEQSISSYLDDALNEDERARIEHLLHTDPEIMNQFVQLKQLRQSLQAIASEDSSIRLDDRFADRVLEAAVSRARAEGLSDDHPLVRLAEQPATERDASGWRWQAIAGVVATVAASIALLVFWPRGSTTDAPSISANAMAELPVERKGPSPAAMIATNEKTLMSEHPVAPAETIPAIASLVTDSEPTPSEMASPDSFASSEPSTEERPSQGNVDTISQPMTADIVSLDSTKNKVRLPKMIFVFEVRQTKSGRASGAVRNALTAAKIEQNNERKITSKMAGVIMEAAKTEKQDETDRFSVLLLEVPAKSVDRFHQNLLADAEGIESVMMKTTIAPDFENDAADSKPLDPTKIRHQGDLSGPDVTAQILVLVK